MKKQLFRDILADTGVPHTIWKFFLISIVLHALLVYALFMVPLTPVDVNVDLHKGFSRKSNRPFSPDVKREYPGTPGSMGKQITERKRYLDSPPERLWAQDTRESYTRTTGGDNIDYTVDDEDARTPIPAETAASSGVVYQYPIRNVDVNVDHYVKMYDKPFLDARKKPLSAFPVLPFNVTRSTPSYRKVKQFIEKKQLPPKQLVKIEELINSFYYDYPMPKGKHPFSITTEMGVCPWAPSHQLLHIGLQGKIVERDIRDKKLVIAKDLKLRVVFNPDRVAAYRLIGYSKRKPRLGQLQDNWKEGRMLHIGQSFTTLYEIIPAATETDKSPDTREEEVKPGVQNERKKEMATVKVSYREPKGTLVKRVSQKVWQKQDKDKESSNNFKFSAAAAQFGMMLKNPELKELSSLITLLELAKDAVGEDRYGYRTEFVKLLEAYKELLKEPE
ncbi:MAG: DUF3520 domain-containing protein [Candidatus Aminicenantes bacterium]|nr:DUF3520 domain-containing protein [Candidatus Aminicenantes bacterium]NIM81834.1 DUF3520 domain-containing protein [Candidatus Aminicenantes bacterium]NIN21207.1 DUF3520 domain-containing protein [Candidatus Aminicenantes bacterium]NIN45031.1 DUF3520 domain-containing protein [Candidatus Aminicenantes bacterium]NIN87849.1 DUF3520 domain-containing protein [Candidatus Aminicenantes bacterium]